MENHINRPTPVFFCLQFGEREREREREKEKKRERHHNSFKENSLECKVTKLAQPPRI